MMSIKKTILSVAIAIPVYATAQNPIPIVPASVMQKAEMAPLEPKERLAQPSVKSAHTSSTHNMNNSSDVVMSPGVNQIVPIAVGHPNRIVTPFGDPEVVSTSLTYGSGNDECGEICIKDNVIYVATNKDHPVTMFITEKGSEARALSLTMVPRKIPPREMFLKLDDQTRLAGLYSNPKAERWEKSMPYVETIRTVFREIALGEVPQGYSMSSIPEGMAPPVCYHPGIDVTFNDGQVLSGHSLSVFVGVAENVSGKTLEFKESACGNWDVAAVTTWPRKVLEPGQKTEVYVSRKNMNERKAKSSAKRPSLIGGRS